MPRLSDSMEEGTIVRWLCADGERVTKGTEIVEIETDKATLAFEAGSDGVLRIVAPEGATMPVGDAIATIGDPDPDPDPDADAHADPDADPDPDPGADADPDPDPDARPAPPPGPAAVDASPVARRMAEGAGISLVDVPGTGPGGRITRDDVASAIDRAAPEAGEGSGAAGKGTVRVTELSRAQQVVARRMAEASATVPVFALTTVIDMTAAYRLRTALKAVAANGAAVPSFNDMVVRASALALRDCPEANGAYRDGRLERYSRVNVGVAVAADDMLLVPVVFDADEKSLTEIADATRDLARRARAGEARPPELTNGTFTVSNLGMYGITSFTPIINPPQAAILGVGEVRSERQGGEASGRHEMSVTLVCDHRVLYGAAGAGLLARIRARLEEPVEGLGTHAR